MAYWTEECIVRTPLCGWEKSVYGVKEDEGLRRDVGGRRMVVT
jgi:hypothetical protein